MLKNPKESDKIYPEERVNEEIAIQKMIKEYCTRYVENIRNFDLEFYPTINDLVGTWSNMETFVMSASMEAAK